MIKTYRQVNDTKVSYCECIRDALRLTALLTAFQRRLRDELSAKMAGWVYLGAVSRRALSRMVCRGSCSPYYGNCFSRCKSDYVEA